MFNSANHVFVEIKIWFLGVVHLKSKEQIYAQLASAEIRTDAQKLMSTKETKMYSIPR
jgi:hypothetical protein